MSDHAIPGPPVEVARPRLARLEYTKRPAWQPTVLTVSDVRNLLAQLRGTRR